jgi:hypothetical protein
MFSLQQNQRTRWQNGFCPEVGRGIVEKTTNTRVSKCKNSKREKKKKEIRVNSIKIHKLLYDENETVIGYSSIPNQNEVTDTPETGSLKTNITQKKGLYCNYLKFPLVL